MSQFFNISLNFLTLKKRNFPDKTKKNRETSMPHGFTIYGGRYKTRTCIKTSKTIENTGLLFFVSNRVSKISVFDQLFKARIIFLSASRRLAVKVCVYTRFMVESVFQPPRSCAMTVGMSSSAITEALTCLKA